MGYMSTLSFCDFFALNIVHLDEDLDIYEFNVFKEGPFEYVHTQQNIDPPSNPTPKPHGIATLPLTIIPRSKLKTTSSILPPLLSPRIRKKKR